VVIGSAGDQSISAALEGIGECMGVVDNALLIFLELRVHRLLARDGFGSNAVHQRPTLQAREYRAVDPVCIFRLAHDQSAPWASECLVSSRGDELGNGYRIGMQTRRHQSCYMGDVTHQICAYLSGDFGKGVEVDFSGVCGVSGDDQFWLGVKCSLSDLIHIQPLGFRVQAIMDNVVQPARKVRLQPGGQMAPVCQVERQYGIPWLEHGQVNGSVRLTAGMWLDVHVFGAKQLLEPVDGKLLDLVHLGTPTIPPPAGIAFGILIGEDRPCGPKHGPRGVILRCDQVQAVCLPVYFSLEYLLELGVRGETLSVLRRFWGSFKLSHISSPTSRTRDWSSKLDNNGSVGEIKFNYGQTL